MLGKDITHIVMWVQHVFIASTLILVYYCESLNGIFLESYRREKNKFSIKYLIYHLSKQCSINRLNSVPL